MFLSDTSLNLTPQPSRSTDLSAKLWSQLPLELIREILLVLSRMSSENARELRLVSSDVNVLVLPVLFKHVVMVLPGHVNRFTATLLPKRKNYIPALKSKLHIIPRLLSSYKVDTWVLVVNDQRPSIETALASIGPVFAGLSKLAITGQNLCSNAFWLRQYPIHPKVVFLIHYGSPHLVNFYEPVFKSVTHLYTCITHGHRYSSVADLPCLTHLAVNTRLDLPETTAIKVAASLRAILTACDRLESLVLTMECTEFDNPRYRMWEYLLEGCREDKRFKLLPDYRSPRLEWLDIVDGGWNLWDRARVWPHVNLLESSKMDVGREPATFPSLRNRTGDDWEIDLVQRDNYHPPEDNIEARGEKHWLSAMGH